MLADPLRATDVEGRITLMSVPALAVGKSTVKSPVRAKVIFPKLNSPVEKAIFRICFPAINGISATVLVAQTVQTVVDVDGTDALIKAIGFQPNSVAEVRRAERLVQQDVSLFRNQKSDVTEMWARGVFERDAEKVARAKDEIAEWNASHPDWKIVINPANVQRRVKEMNKLSGERMIKAAPKEIRGNVSSVLKSESLQ